MGGNYTVTDTLTYNRLPCLPGMNMNYVNPSDTIPSIWTDKSATSTTSTTSTGGSSLDDLRRETKEAAKNDKKRKEASKKNNRNESKLFPGSGLTKEHDEALEKLLKQMHDAGYDTPALEYAMEHGLTGLSAALWAPMVPAVGKFFGGPAAAQGIYKYTGTKWVVDKSKAGYNYVRNARVVKPVADVISKGNRFVNTHGILQADISAKYLNKQLGLAGENAGLGLKAGATASKACATGVRYVAKYGGLVVAGKTVYDDRNKLSTAWEHDTSTGLKQTGQTAAKAAGAGVGFWAGAKGGALLGAKIGGVIGAFFGGVGAPVGAGFGALLGGIAGGLLGSWGGKKLAQKAVGPDVADSIEKKKVTAKNQKAEDIKENVDIYTEMAGYVDKVGQDKIDKKALEALQVIMATMQT